MKIFITIVLFILFMLFLGAFIQSETLKGTIEAGLLTIFFGGVTAWFGWKAV